MQERLAGFLVCFIVGNACQASAFAHLPEVFEGRPRAFALIYTLGNTVAIGGCASLLLTPAPLRRRTAAFSQMAAL